MGLPPPDPTRRPAGANLAFECLEPYRRWRVTFDGFCLRMPYEQLRTALVVDGDKVRCTVDLQIECATPVWDAHEAAEFHTGAGSMREQSWATEHYEQLYRATGTIRVGDRTLDFDGSGWRDHSRGPRGGNTGGAAWGGHVILGALFDSGRALGLSRYWSPDGATTLEGGYVVVDGVLHHARVLDVPRLMVAQRAGETLPVVLEWDGGRLDVELTTTTSFWMSFDAGLPYGVKPGFTGCTYSVGWGEVTWEGETTSVYLERSDPLPALSPDRPPRPLEHLMPGTLIVMSNPVPGKEQEYDTWYQQQHLVDVVAVPGVARAQRFRLASEEQAPAHRYLAVYELDGEPADVAAELAARFGTDAMPMSDAMDMTTIGMTMWETHGDPVTSSS